MAFPTTGVLDNFNRTDAANLGADWTDVDAGLKITSNLCAGTATDTEYMSYWDAAAFSGDLEAFVTLSFANDTGEAELRMVDSLGLGNGYRATFIVASSIIRIRRLDVGVGTQLGADISQAIGLTDQIGLSRIGGVITVYLNGASVGTRSDSTHTPDSYLYLDIYTGDSLLNDVDNFGGGTVVAASGSGSMSPRSSYWGDV